MQILLDEGEMMTLGMDGYIRVNSWFFFSIIRLVCMWLLISQFLSKLV